MAAANGRAPVAERRAGARSELDDLRATCQRQASVIDTLGEAISTFRVGTSALKAENADLRAENHQMRERLDTHSRGHGAPDEAELAEVGLSPNVQAPAAARAVVTRELRDRVTASVLEQAQLRIRVDHQQRAPQWRAGGRAADLPDRDR
jgi:regulator of replication initiation timing